MIDVIGQAPDAGDVEDRLHQHRAAEQDPDFQAEQRHDRVDRRRARPGCTTLRSRQALGARGADVVLVHHLEQAAAHQAREHRRAARRQHEPRHDQRGEPFPGIGGEPDVAARAGEDLEFADVAANRNSSDQPEPEFGRRDQQQRAAHRARGRAQEWRLQRRDDADRQTADRSTATAAPTVSEIVAGSRSLISCTHRLVAVVAVAEVEVQEDVLQVVPELRRQRFVQAQRRVRSPCIGFWVRVAAGPQHRRVARREAPGRGRTSARRR